MADSPPIGTESCAVLCSRLLRESANGRFTNGCRLVETRVSPAGRCNRNLHADWESNQGMEVLRSVPVFGSRRGHMLVDRGALDIIDQPRRPWRSTELR